MNRPGSERASEGGATACFATPFVLSFPSILQWAGAWNPLQDYFTTLGHV